ncbi:MAG TPA: cytochrome c oxidase subunit II [Gemmataceae bacterium]|nr:cytochrome c oxidase subunit II [Gemmataceae bacterium]
MKWWSLLFAVVILVEVVFVLLAPLVGWGLPPNYASYGSEIDNLFHLILALTGIVFILTEAILIYNMYRFARSDGRRSQYTHGHHRLEIIWTAVPAVILLFIAFAQVGAWERVKYKSRMPPADQVFEVSARQFEWRVRYPSAERMDDPKLVETFAREAQENKKQVDDVHRVNEIHVWKGGQVRVYLKTRDVLHSFFLPHLRIKQDAVPGKTIPVWFDTAGPEAEANFIYDPSSRTWKETKPLELACAELCGWGHYKMRGKLFIHESKEDFIRWLKHAAAEQNATKD